MYFDIEHVVLSALSCNEKQNDIDVYPRNA